MSYNDIISHSEGIVKVISNSKDVKFILDLPVIYDAVNFIVGDSGVGKTILNQCIINSLLEKEKDCIVVWLDCEFQSSIAKQRKIDVLLRKHLNSLILIDVENYIKSHNSRIDKEIEKITNTTNGKNGNEIRKKKDLIYMLKKERIENSANFVLHVSELVCNNNKDKKVIFVIDSLEDIVNNTSEDASIKDFLSSILHYCNNNATYIISHHISKKQDVMDSMRFRGSMVIKNKCASMLLIHSKEKENTTDNVGDNYIYNMEILKLRAYAPFSRKFFVTVSLGNDYIIKKIEKNYDIHTRQVIREAFFLLSSDIQKHIKKTDLIFNIHKETKIAKEKVRNIIDANNDLFNVTVDRHNKQIYCINANKIEQICLISGISSADYLTSSKQDLIKILDNVDDDKELNIEITNSNFGISVYKKKAAILNNIFSITDEEAKLLIQNINIKK